MMVVLEPEMRRMMQYLFQSFNFRGDGKPYLDLIQAVAAEEISHVELISKTISKLLDGAPGYPWSGNTPFHLKFFPPTLDTLTKKTLC